MKDVPPLLAPRIRQFLLTTLLVALVVSPFLICDAQQATSIILAKQGCELSRKQGEEQITSLRKQITRDIGAIRNLSSSFETNQGTIEQWLQLSEQAREYEKEKFFEAVKDLAVDQLISGLNQMARTQINFFPPDAAATITKYNITSPQIQDWLYSFALLNTRDPTWYVKVTNSINGFKIFGDLSNVKEVTDWATVVTDIIPLAFKDTFLNANPYLKQSGLLLSDSEFALASIINNITQRASLAEVSAFAALNEQQLRDLKRLSDLLQRHVRELNNLTKVVVSLQKCIDDSSWELYLKRLRLEAIRAGNVSEYNSLVTQHAAIYAQLGYEPCRSGLFPAGCVTKEGVTVPRSGDVAKSCLPVPANNVTEANWIENASNHSVCWTRGDQGQLFALGDLAPDQYKSQLTETIGPESALPSPSGSDASGSQNGSLSTQPTVAAPDSGRADTKPSGGARLSPPSARTLSATKSGSKTAPAGQQAKTALVGAWQFAQCSHDYSSYTEQERANNHPSSCMFLFVKNSHGTYDYGEITGGNFFDNFNWCSNGGPCSLNSDGVGAYTANWTQGPANVVLGTTDSARFELINGKLRGEIVSDWTFEGGKKEHKTWTFTGGRPDPMLTKMWAFAIEKAAQH